MMTKQMMSPKNDVRKNDDQTNDVQQKMMTKRNDVPKNLRFNMDGNNF